MWQALSARIGPRAAALLKLQSDIVCWARQIREEPCLSRSSTGCSRQLVQTDQILMDYKARRECLDQNIMICKSCRVDFILNQTLRSLEGQFEVWCFEAGEFLNTVSPKSQFQNAFLMLPASNAMVLVSIVDRLVVSRGMLVVIILLAAVAQHTRSLPHSFHMLALHEGIPCTSWIFCIGSFCISMTPILCRVMEVGSRSHMQLLARAWAKHELRTYVGR